MEWTQFYRRDAELETVLKHNYPHLHSSSQFISVVCFYLVFLATVVTNFGFGLASSFDNGGASNM